MLYKTVKGFSDATIRSISQSLPTWHTAPGETGLAAVASYTPQLPVNIQDLPEALAPVFHEQIVLPARQLFELRDVYVSWHALIFNNLRIFQPALAYPTEEAVFQDSYLLKQWLAKRVTPPAGPPLALVHDQWTRGNYYHWMVDSLCRLMVLRAHFPQARLFMPEPVPTYVRTSAALLGYTNFLSVTEPQVLYASHLVVPEHTTPPGYHHPELLPQVRDALVKGLGPANPPTPTRRVYVSRARQNSRHLRNEAAAQAVLERYGFETIYFEGMTLEEQVRLMLETHVFVGVHGANLTNLLFLQPGAVVVELMNEEKFLSLGNKNFENLIYYRMSSCLNLPYYALPCRNVADQQPSNYSDIEVSPAALEKILQQILES